jgi:hypothetical protein
MGLLNHQLLGARIKELPSNCGFNLLFRCDFLARCVINLLSSRAHPFRRGQWTRSPRPADGAGFYALRPCLSRFGPRADRLVDR